MKNEFVSVVLCVMVFVILCFCSATFFMLLKIVKL
jgi:hypothetical protein